MFGILNRKPQQPVKSEYELHTEEMRRIERWISINSRSFPSAGPEDRMDSLNFTMEYQRRWGLAVIALAEEEGITLTHTKWSDYVYS